MKRSAIMRRVKSKDTGPELLVRKLTHSLGYRYRLHDQSLPGKPDMVFKSRKKVVFINGCFWHGHKCKRGNRIPIRNREYWKRKIQMNVDRDKRSHKLLLSSGWSVLVVWECKTKDKRLLEERLEEFLG